MSVLACKNRAIEMVHNFPLWILDHLHYDRHAEAPYENLQAALNSLVDITKLPPAKGKLRNLQLTEVLLLRVFQEFCYRHHFDFCLAYGTLIGAIRHKGFIPWDDDLDVFVFSDQYDKIKQTLLEEMKGTRFELWGVDKCRYGDASLRISHKDLPVLNLDLFYLFPSSLETPLPSNVVARIDRFKKKYIFELRYNVMRRGGRHLLEEFQHNTDAEYSKIIQACDRAVAKSFLPNPFCAHIILPANTVLPLKESLFEGNSFPVPNNPREHLTIRYNDWMSFPSRFSPHGDQFMKFKDEDALKMIAHLQKCLEVGRFI